MTGGASNSALPILPARAPVIPRATLHGQTASLPVEQWVHQCLENKQSGVIAIVGDARSGKTTALSHLASIFGDDPPLTLLDEPNEEAIVAAREGALIFTAREPALLSRQAVHLHLSGWTDEDLIEYLLHFHRLRCNSVMSRLMKDDDRGRLCGSPHLWRIVLDGMAADETLPDTSAALRQALDDLLPDDCTMTRAGKLAMWMLCKHPQFSRPTPIPARVRDMLQHRIIQLLLGCEQIVWRLSMSVECEELAETLPPDVITEIARRTRHRPAVLQRLESLSRSDRHFGQQSMAISLLVAADRSWRPTGESPMLIQAMLCGARWPRVNLADASMSGADFSGADLSNADLSRGSASGATFLRANLQQAAMIKLIAVGADLTAADLHDANADSCDFRDANLQRADLRGAILRNASFIGARLQGANLAGAQARGSKWDCVAFGDSDLREANFSHADLRRVDLTRAQLDGANFHHANLNGANLGGLETIAACFREANLSQADLTGAVLRFGDFRNADLRGAGLADVDFEGADLRGVDFSDASFHMGSSRSGLVASVIPCEGSKTGFYTDEFDEQDFRSPEEIRKANLRGANLHGAIVDQTDWYLVDLRGASYSRSQAEHFAQCGAILKPRGGVR